MKRRVLSLLMVGAMLFSTLPVNALAVGNTDAGGLCPHHRSHVDCGYIAPTEGQPCTHEHTEECYTEITACVHVHDESCYSVLSGEDRTEDEGQAEGEEQTEAQAEDREADACTHICTEESGCVTLVLDCTHAHGSDCGYIQADPGQPCGYACRICPIEDLIATLPDTVAEDNRAEVETRLREILALYTELTEEEQEQVNLAHVLELQAALDAAKAPMRAAAANSYDLTQTNTIKITKDNQSTYNGATITSGGTRVTDKYIEVDGATVSLTISDLKIWLFEGKTNSPAIWLKNNANLTLTLSGANEMCGYGTWAAIAVPQGCTLTIEGSDSDTLIAGSADVGGAGIGGNFSAFADPAYGTVGTIIINGGNLDVTGGPGSAGIGGGLGCSTGSVTINGGVVSAKGSYSVTHGGWAGIGGGMNGHLQSITINGGTVTATGAETMVGVDVEPGAGIGMGSYNAPGADDYPPDCGHITITGGKVSGGTIGFGGTRGADASKKKNSSITIGDDADLTGCSGVIPLPAGYAEYTFKGVVYDESIEGNFNAAFSVGSKQCTVNVRASNDEPYRGDFQVKLLMKKTESANAALTWGGKTLEVTGVTPSGTTNLTFGEPKYAYYSLKITIYDEAITANRNAQVTFEGVTKSVTLTKTAEYCGEITIDKVILPLEAQNRSSNVTVKAEDQTWTGTATTGTNKTLVIGTPILPADLTLDLAYGDISFVVVNGGAGTVTYYDSDGTQRTSPFSPDKIVEVIQSSSGTATTHRLSINTPGGSHIRIKNVNMTGGSEAYSPIDIAGEVTLEISGENVVESTVAFDSGYRKSGKAAIHVPDGATLTLTGSGSLEARVSSDAFYGSAGIGGNYGTNGNSGTIVIESGTITAVGGFQAAGIGGGYYGTGTVIINGGTVTATGKGDSNEYNGGAGIGGGCSGGGTVTINGGRVIATGGGESRYGGAGIGSGYSGEGAAVITITGGVVIATPGKNASGIGKGNEGSNGTVTITGGNIQAPEVLSPTNGTDSLSVAEITLSGVDGGVPVTEAAGIGAYGLQDVYTLDGGMLYFYLPAGTLPSSITAGGVEYVPDGAGSKNYIIAFSVELKDYPLTRQYDGNSLANPTAAQIKITGNTGFNDLTFEWYQGSEKLSGPPVNVGSYVLKISNKAGSSKDFEITITQCPLGSAKVAVDGECTYNGSVQNPTVSVTLGNKTLVKDTDYTVAYSNNVNAGPATVTVTGRGNYEGTKSTTFTIAQKPLTPAITGTTTKTYDGTDTAPADTAIGLTGVVSGDDVTATATFAYDSPDAGEHKTITAKNIALSGDGAENYTLAPTSELTTTGTITKASASVTTAPAAYTLTYNRQAQALVSAGTASFGDIEYALGENGEYSKSVPNGTNAGNYTVWYRVPGTDNYTGAAPVSVSVTISPKTVDAPTIELSSNTFEYDGAEKEPSVTAVKDDENIIPASEYTVAYSNNINAGTAATVTITDNEGGNYTVNGSKTFEITKPSLSTAQVELSGGSYTYDGAAKTPTVTVKKNGADVADSEYDITYSNTNGGAGNHTNAGTVTVTVKAKENGNYSGSNSATFTIAPKAITAVVTAENKTYNGERDATVSAEVDSRDLVSGDDITITGLTGIFADANVGTGKTVAIDSTAANVAGSGAGNYEINYPATVTADITPAEVTLTFADQTITYGDTPEKATADPESAEITYSYIGTDATTGSVNGWPINAGTYTITAKVEASGNYEAASKTATLIINPKEVSNPTIELSPDTFEYDGSEKKPSVTAVKDGETVIPASEYSVAYSNNVNVGATATVTITDKEGGNYNVSGSKTFVITKPSLEKATVTLSETDFTYNGAEHTPAVTVVKDGRTLERGTDYTVSYDGNTDAGTATVTVTGTGNYEGTNSADFTIAPKPLTPAITGTTTKPYDGTNAAPAGLAIGLTGVVSGDNVTATASSYTYNSADVDKATTITAHGITLDGASKGNYTLTGDTTNVPGRIAKSVPTIVFVEDYGPGKTYDGQPIANPTEDDLTITGAKFDAVEFTWSDTPLNAGTYTLTASILATTNTEAATSDPLTVTIAPKAVNDPTIELSPDTFEYDGNEKKPAVTVKDGETVISDSEYTVEYSNNVNVGATATVTVGNKAGGNYVIGETSANFTITKANQAALSITGAPGSVTYGDTFQLDTSGGSGAGSVSWSAAGATVDSDGNVTVTKAGQVTISATKAGDNNYDPATAEITITVNQKALTVTGAAAADRAYDGTNVVKITGVAISGKVRNDDDVSVDTSNLTGTINGADAGTYTTVTLPTMDLAGAAADNYTLTRPAGAVSAGVTISKAAALTPKTGDLAVANNQSHTYTYGLDALRPDVPEGMSLGSAAVTYTLGTVSLTGGYYTGDAKIEGQTLTLPIQQVDSGEERSIGTITVTIHTGNFEDMTATIHVRTVNKTIPEGAPTLSRTTLTYGQSLGAITLSGSMKDGGKTVPGVFVWSSPENRPAAQESYEAAWVFTPTDNVTYADVNGTSAIKVDPAPITGAVITLSETTYRYDGEGHTPSITSVKLDEDDTVLTVDVDYTAEIPTGTDAGTYTVTITGKGNYAGTAEISFTINPVNQMPLDQQDDSGHDLRLEVETGLSTVPATLHNNPKFDTTTKIEAVLRTEIEKVMSDVGKNIAVFDVALMVSRDGGETWQPATRDNFPQNGKLTVTLPYPDDTNISYHFTVVHMFTTNDFNMTPGDIETPTVTNTADGIRFTVTGLSPISVGWTKASTPTNPTGPTGGGGGGYVSTYAVTVEKPEHGKVTSNRTNAASGNTVTLTVTPDSGYVLDTLTVTDSRGNEIKLTAQGGGKYTFTMPGRAVTVKATFAPLPDGTDKPCDGGADCPSHGYTDLGGVGTWYHEAVDYVLRNGLMNGYSSGMFGPNDYLSRAQLAQILYNREGRPVVSGSSVFTDVADGAWYTEAIRWAASNGIVSGYGNGEFGPNDNITREQLAVMLWRYVGSPAATNKELHFTDADEASGYALEALRWAVENGVINGYGDGRFGPKGLATRAQVAQMLKNFLGK